MVPCLDDIELLEKILPVFVDIATHLAGDSDDAKAAQAAVKQHSTLERPFHATVYAQLYKIEWNLCAWSTSSYLQSESAQQAVKPLLIILDDIAQTAIPDQARLLAPLPLPGLQRILEIIDLGASNADDHLHTIQEWLFCPSFEQRERLESGLISCATALDPQGLPLSVHDIAQSQKLLLPVKAFCENAESLESLLKSQLNCRSCGYQHDAVFSFATPHPGLDGPRCSLLMSFRKDTSSRDWHTARVEFAGSTSRLEGGAGAIFCQDLYTSATEVYLRPTGSSFSRVLSKDAYCREGVATLTSLSSWIADTSEGSFANIREKDRLILCLLLSYGYLYLSGSFLWPDQRVDAGVWLPDYLENKVIRPFLQFSASQGQTGPARKGFAIEDCMNLRRPSLPAFGKLILEIWLGRSLKWDNDVIELARRDCERSVIGAHILQVAYSCIYGGDIFKREGRLRHDKLMHEKFSSDVVKILQFITKFAGVPPEEIINLLQAQMRTDSRAVHAHIASAPLHVSTTRATNSDSLVSHSSATGTGTSEWFEQLRRHVHGILDLQDAGPRIKVAILDTGANFNKNQYKLLHRGRITDCRTWCDTRCSEKGRQIMNRDGHIEIADRDTDGHGTHSLSTLRKVAPNCEVFVAQVFKDRFEVKDGYPTAAHAERIAKAIEYAAHFVQADIITMSFGFQDQVGVISNALDRAATRSPKPCLMFAAASNVGANDDIQWPASHPRVVCIHATDSNGNKYPRNATSQSPEKEFAILGIGVEAFIGPHGSQAVKSGTSVAAPIAAGIAALILHDVQSNRSAYLDSMPTRDRHQLDSIYDKKLKMLRTREGMCRVLMSMSESRDGYNCLRPWKVLCKSGEADHMRARDILKTASPGKVRADPS